MDNIRIMVVEDENIVALDIKNRLRGLGYIVVALAASGKEAVSKAIDHQPNLVLMDIRLKGEIDGIETADQIRRQLDIPVIYLTAYADDATLQRAKITAPYGYLLKPFEERDLHIAIEMALYRHRMERKIKESEKWLSAILENIQDGVVALDESNRIMFANSVAREYLPLLTSTAVGEELTHLGASSLDSFLEPPAQGKIHHEVVIEEPTDQIFEVLVNPAVADLFTNGAVLIIRDVTEARAMQANMQQQDRLAVVGQLAAGIAHDFNNILTGIIGFAELLQRRLKGSDVAQSNLSHIIQQGQRAAYLVKQILDFSRKSIIYRETVDMVWLIEETVDLLKRTIPETIFIAFTPPAQGSFTVDGGVAQLQQILTNLALNAKDAMPQGGRLTFKLSALMVTPGVPPPYDGMPVGPWIVISVIDTGEGIKSTVLPHIFEPFYTTKDVGQGTGLGLAQVYGIVKQHEGFIDVKSHTGQGTIFTVYLPAVNTVSFRKTETNPDWAGSRNQTLLLVEDEASVLEVGQVLLSHLGYNVITATNGREALEIYDNRGSDISLVLTDMTMPELGGLALAKELRNRNPESRVVMLTGYPLQVDTKELLAQGVVDWLIKPLSLEKLAVTVRNSIEVELKTKD